MLLQGNGRQILLLPAWPEDWNASFKLNVPYKTTVEGPVVHGKLTRLVVQPEAHRKDIVLSGKG
jgi:hypothetical protein